MQLSGPHDGGTQAVIIVNEDEFPWILLSCFEMFGKSRVTFISRALPSQGLPTSPDELCVLRAERLRCLE